MIIDHLSGEMGAIGTTDSTHPTHYNTANGKQAWDIMVDTFGKEATIHFCQLNAFKYLERYKRKNGAEDIDKAIVYLNKLKELEYET